MASELDLSRLKHINEVQKHAVFGFVRECQLVLPIDDNVFYTIPDIVYHLCLLYYAVSDEWDSEFHGPGYRIQGDLLIKTSAGYQSAFLQRKVSAKGIYRWGFKVEQFTNKYQGWDWIIGVWKTNKKRSEMDATSSYFTPQHGDKDGYGWLASCQKLGDPDAGGCYLKSVETYGEVVNTGDVIEMVLDLNQRQIHWAVNGVHFPIAFSDIEQCEYRAAVMLASDDSRIRIWNNGYNAGAAAETQGDASSEVKSTNSKPESVSEIE